MRLEFETRLVVATTSPSPSFQMSNTKWRGREEEDHPQQTTEHITETATTKIRVRTSQGKSTVGI